MTPLSETGEGSLGGSVPSLSEIEHIDPHFNWLCDRYRIASARLAALRGFDNSAVTVEIEILRRRRDLLMSKIVGIWRARCE